MDRALSVVTFLSALGAGLNGGLFFAFSGWTSERSETAAFSRVSKPMG